MQKKILQLDNEQIELLKENYEVLHFSHDYDIVYENQIPTTGLALLEGEIELVKRSKVLKKITPFTLLGLYNLFHNEKTSLGCKIKMNSKIIIIGKSDLTEVINNSKSKLFNLFKVQT